jgi:hypothetical protein
MMTHFVSACYLQVRDQISPMSSKCNFKRLRMVVVSAVLNEILGTRIGVAIVAAAVHACLREVRKCCNLVSGTSVCVLYCYFMA